MCVRLSRLCQYRIIVLLLLAACLTFAQEQQRSQFATFDASALPVSARIQIGGDPDWLAIGFGSVWVSVPKTNEVVRIDPRRNVVKARITVDQEPCYGIGIGRSWVWVLNCKSQTLTRIDPEKEKVDLTVPVSIAPEGEGSIAVDDSGVWFVGNEDGHSSTLVHVEQLHGNMLRKIPIGAESAVVTLGFGSVWVTSSGENRVYRVDPETGNIVAKIPVAAKPRFTTIGAGSVWVLSQSDGSVSRINPATNTVQSVTNAGVPGEGGDIAGGGSYIWVSAAGVPLIRIFPQSAKVADEYNNYRGADAIRFGFNSVWISDHGKGNVWRIDPEKLPVY
ncbi:MAG TPA: hypothetical protein VI685_16930 [Candidatus Angelobacter sp.]